ncbi:6051_t:CDS:2, partial [Gigaspora rosea]
IEEKFTEHITDRLTQREDPLTLRGKRHRFFPSLNINDESPENLDTSIKEPIQHMMRNLFVVHDYLEKTITRQNVPRFIYYMLMNLHVVVIKIRQLSVIDTLKYLLLTRATPSSRENVATEFNGFLQMLSEEQFINLITKILPICFEVNSIVENIDKILQDNVVTAENFVSKLLGPYTLAFLHVLNRIDIEPLIWLRQFNQTHPTWMALG